MDVRIAYATQRTFMHKYPDVNEINSEEEQFLRSMEDPGGDNRPPLGGEFEDFDDMLSAMKERASVVLLEGRALVIVETDDGAFQLMAEGHARLWLGGFQMLKLAKDKEGKEYFKRIPALPLYVKSEECLRFEGITPDPRVKRRLGHIYGTFTGFSRKAKKGKWTKLRKHILEYVCGGNQYHFNWLISWIAQIIQEPHLKLGTAVVLVGPKGCGKTTVAMLIRELIGKRHSCKVSQSSHVTGHFNSHLRDCFFLQVEEALWAGSKAAEGVLKDLITGETLTVEGKGLPVMEFPNFSRLMLLANPGWVVPATGDERRFFVLNCVDPCPGLAEDHPDRAAYFSDLYDAAKAGELEAMMWDLQNDWDIHQVNLRKPPVTDGLKEQVAHSMSSEEEWLSTTLMQGQFTDRNGMMIAGTDNWELDHPFEIATASLLTSYRDHVKLYSGSSAGAKRVVDFMKKYGVMTSKRLTIGNDRPHGWVLGPRREWQKAFTKLTHVEFETTED